MKRMRNQVLLPMNLEIKIAENDPVRKLVEICEELDYTKLYDQYLRTWRKYNPETIFMLLVCGYMNRLYSSREIENACRTDIRFMWILQDEPVPDHSTIARFQEGKLLPVIEDLFYQLIMKLMSLGEVSYDHVFVDGTKIEANANRYSFVWAKAVEKFLHKETVKTLADVEKICKAYGFADTLTVEECIERLYTIAARWQIDFVHGKGKHKTQLQCDLELLEKHIEKKEQYLAYLQLMNGRKSFSKTDTDATFMRMKEDHMKNGQLKPGYNVQIMVNSEYVVGLGAFATPNDVNTLVTFMERVYSHTHERIRRLIADAGYESEENYTYLQANGQDAFIKPSNYEQNKKRKKNPYAIGNMPYNEEEDRFICPNNKRLVYTRDQHSKTQHGYDVTQRVYVCENCEGCPHRAQCHKGAKNREVKTSVEFKRQRAESLKNIQSEEGILLRMNRSIQVEGTFGVWKQDYRFRRFAMRGKQGIETQLFLLAFAYNIQKLCNRIENGRFGMALFEKQIA